MASDGQFLYVFADGELRKVATGLGSQPAVSLGTRKDESQDFGNVEE